MPDAPAATDVLSTTSTSWPRSARCQAVERPWTPAPMTRIEADDGTRLGISVSEGALAHGGGHRQPKLAWEVRVDDRRPVRAERFYRIRRLSAVGEVGEDSAQ